MKTIKKKKEDEMRAEYDFSKAERGKFYRPLDKGYTVHVQKSDRTVIVNHYTLAEGTVLLAPDVLEYFPELKVRQRSVALAHQLDGSSPCPKI